MKALCAAFIFFVSMTTAGYADEVPSRPLFAPVGQAAVPITAPTGLPQSTSPDTKNKTNLGSFMFFSAQQWSFWWRGQRVAPDAIPSGMTGLSVTADTVQFTFDGVSYRFDIGKFN